jgi:hypothetical protein
MEKIICFLAFLALLFSACEYQPEGIYEVDIEPVTDTPEITVNLNFETDTIYVPTTGYVTLSYSTPDQKVKFAYFELNKKQLMSIESTSGTFTFSFNSSQYQKRIPYDLTIQLFRSSGSGSLADKMNMEGFLYSKSFVLIFEDESRMAPQIINVSPQNGSLKVTWEKFKGIGFLRYHVFNSVFYKIDIITDPNQTYLYDNSYIGYNAEYYIVTETDNNSFTSKHVSFEDGLPDATAQLAENTTTKITWGQSKYYNNIAGYRIFESYNRYNHFQEIASIENSTDTSLFYEDGRFGVSSRFYVMPVPVEREIPLNSFDDLRYRASVTEDVLVGEKMPVFPMTFFHNPPGNFCYYSDIENIYKFDCSKNDFISSIPTRHLYLSVSPDGKTILSSNIDRIEIIDANTMEIRDIIPVPVLPDGQLLYQFLIANNGKGVFSNELGDYYYYDYNERVAEAKFRVDGESNMGDKMCISPDGKFFCIRHVKGIYPNYLTELYKLEEGKAIQIWTDNEVDFFDFDPGNGQFLYFKDGKITRIFPEDMSVISELPINDPYIYSIDWNNEEFICLNAIRDLFSIYDLNSGEIKHQLKTFNFGGYNSDYDHAVLSNKILFTQGLRLKLLY